VKVFGGEVHLDHRALVVYLADSREAVLEWGIRLGLVQRGEAFEAGVSHLVMVAGVACSR